MKQIVQIFLGWLLLFSVNSQAADDAIPAEIKALIGNKIFAKTPKTVGDVPDWKITGGGTLVGTSIVETNLGYELRHKGNINIFWIDTIDSDYNRTILDVRVLPQSLLFYDIKDDKIIPKKNWRHLYMFQHSCQKDSSEKQVIVALIRPEQGKDNCVHWTSQVKLAWSIDSKTGRISEISPKGISCHYDDAEDACQ